MKLYIKYFSMLLKCQMEYKASFVMSIIGQFLMSFSVFLGVYFMMSRFNTVKGFSFSEVALCFSVILAAFSLSECFFRGFDTFPNIIGGGEFDRIMVRPRNEIFQVLVSRIDLTRIGKLAQSVLMLAYGMVTIDIAWTPDKIFTLCAMILGGTLVFCSLFLIYAGISFFTLEGLEFMNIFTDGAREFGRYPFSIYGQGVLKFLTYVIPLALVQYYPLLYIIGREESHIYMFLPLIAGLFIIPGYLIWRFGLRHYKSTGS